MSTEQRRVVKVFLASPSDLAPERLIAKEIVDKLNKQWAEFFSLQVELVGWEETVSRFGRPQALIYAELDHCTPPDSEGIIRQDLRRSSGGL